MRTTIAWVLLSLGLLTSPALARRAKDAIDVMTMNQYIGADISLLANAADLKSLFQGIQDTLSQVAENNFPERAAAMAEIIAKRSPEVVALQEVSLITLDGATPGPPFVDHLDETVKALDEIGSPYVPVAQVQNAESVFDLPDFGTVRTVDRDVILVRKDLASNASPIPFNSVCKTPSLDGCHFETFLPIDNPDPVPDDQFVRGYVGIDINIKNEWYRIVNTHLEVDRPAGIEGDQIFQSLQAAELLQTLEAFPNPNNAKIIVAGDFNSKPDDPIIPSPEKPLIPGIPFPEFIVPPYQQFIDAGFTDVWTFQDDDYKGKKRQRRGGNPQGFTCCQAEDLSNRRSLLDQRIDFIFTADVPSRVRKARVLGDSRSEKTSPSKLWPSDHATVAARIEY